jgi:YVTN family beta-propeller protein
LWLPNRAVAADGLPPPSLAPAIIFNTASNATTEIAPTIGNTSAFLYDPGSQRLYSADFANGSVGVIDSANGAWLKTIPVGSEPAALVLDPASDLLFVANSGSSNVTVINCTTNSIEAASISTGPSPHALAFDPVDGSVFVADAGDSWVWSINVKTDASAEFAAVSGFPEGVSYSQAGKSLAVTSSSGSKMTLLQGNLPVTIALATVGSGALPVETNANGTEFVVGISTGSSLVVVNSSTGAIEDSKIPVGTNVTSLALNSGSDTAFAWGAGTRNLTAVNLDSDQVMFSSPTLGPEPGSTAYDPLTNRLFVASSLGGAVIILNATSGATAAAPLRFNSPAMSLAVEDTTDTLYIGLLSGVYAVDPTTGAVVASAPTLSDGNSPLLVDTSDGVLWVANGASGLVALHLSNLALDVTVGIHTGVEVQQETMALDPSARELFVVNDTAQDVEVVDTSTDTIYPGAVAGIAGASAIAYDSTDNLVYVAGSNVSLIDPTTRDVVGSSIPLVAHAITTGIAFDPSRSYLYVTTAVGLPTSSGTVSVIDGSNLSASYGSQVTFPVGELPTDPDLIFMNRSQAPAFSVIWVANLQSGTLSVITSPPEVTFFTASPDPVDLDQATQLLLGYLGGSGPDTISYADLPSGCSSANASTLNCTPSISGSFLVTATIVDVFGLTATASVQLTVSPALSVRTSLAPGSALDVDKNLSATADASGGTPAYTYSWSFGDGTRATGPDAVHEYGSPGQYLLNVSVTDGAHNEVTATTIVEVNPPPVASVSVTPASATDVNLPLTFNAAISGGTSPSAGNWSFGDGTSATGGNVSHSWTRPGDYNVTFRSVDESGEVAEEIVAVHIFPELTASFSAGVAGSNASATPGTNVSFLAKVVGGMAPYRVTWSFADGSEAVGSSVTHAYANPGSYSVHVSVVDAAGARVVASLPVTVVPSPSSTSGPNATFDLGVFFGLVVGGALASVVFFVAVRSRRRNPPPPSPYVPPARSSSSEWRED